MALKNLQLKAVVRSMCELENQDEGRYSPSTRFTGRRQTRF